MDFRFPRAIVAAFALTALAGAASPTETLPYPDGYRHWTHVKSGVNDPAHLGHGRYAGMYHIYANEAALAGYRTGRFPDGAMLVFDLHEAEAKDHNTQAGERRFIDVMYKNSRAFADADGWGYEEFDRDSRDRRLVSAGNLAPTCHACHTTQKAKDFVFSRYAD